MGVMNVVEVAGIAVSGDELAKTRGNGGHDGVFNGRPKDGDMGANGRTISWRGGLEGPREVCRQPLNGVNKFPREFTGG